MSERVSTSRLLSCACSGDMYSGVPSTVSWAVCRVRSVSDWCIALASPKSMTLGTGLVVVGGDENVGGFQIAVDDPLLVRVLDGRTYLHEQVQPLRHTQPRGVAILGDRHALDVLHDEEGPA